MNKVIDNIFGSMTTFLTIMFICLIALCAKAYGWEDGAPIVFFGILAADKAIEYTEGVEVPFPVINADIIYGGGLTCVNAAGYALPGSDTAGLIFVGVALERVDNSSGSAGDKSVNCRRRGLFKLTLGTAISQANVGDNVFLVDDQTVDVTGNTTHGIFCGIIAAYIDTTHAWVDIEPAIKQADVATHIADSSAAHAASAISIADAGNFTAAAQVEAALQEIYQDLKTIQGTVPIPLGVIMMEDGTALTKQATTVAGYAQLANKEIVINIPINCSAGETLGFSVPLPQDIDVTADLHVHVLAGKDADNDVLTLDCEVFPVAAGDVANADIQDTAAQTIVAAGTELTFTCGLDGLLASPSALTVVLILGGTNDGDAAYIYAAWLEYKKKLLTS
jgi:hypothetical protein